MLLELPKHTVKHMANSFKGATFLKHLSQSTQLTLHIAVTFLVASKSKHWKGIEHFVAGAMHQCRGRFLFRSIIDSHLRQFGLQFVYFFLQKGCLQHLRLVL